MSSDVFGVRIPRVCRMRGTQDPEDLVARGESTFRSHSEEVVTDLGNLREGVLTLPSVVAKSGAMVVLGEPGAGKTSVLNDLTSKLPRVVESWDGLSDACLWVSGGDLTESSYGEELGCHLAALPPTEDADGAGVLTVVLDQADESSYLRRLARRLTMSLRGRAASRVRLLMACRTADYPETMTAALSDVLGTCRLIDLAPLTREEAETLADSAGVPGKVLVDAAEASGAAVLASTPLTLELLVLTYQADGRLQGTPHDLFARGVRSLVEDPDPGRLTREVATTAQQRLAVAGRVAAWMLLSGHRAVWRGAAFGARGFDLNGDVLVGGTERTTAGSFDATPQVLEETLATALFTVPDESRVVFRHSSVSAYLAAQYLLERTTTQRQLENLLLIGTPDGETANIPVPLRELAAWLVAMNPAATGWLASADPESLAVHSTLVRSDEIRALTVSRLLDRAAEVELSDLRWQLARWDLNHPGLADQLVEVLETAPIAGAADWQTVARVRLAIQLAEEAGPGHGSLAEALLRVVENDVWQQSERGLAARAAFGCDSSRTVPVLKVVLTALDDPSSPGQTHPGLDHDLRGALLTLLWPDHIDVASMLAALQPSVEHVYNAYTQFLRTMPDHAAEEHLPLVLDWAQNAVLEADSLTPGFVFSSDRIENSLIESVINRALDSPNAQQYVDALAKMILRLFEDHHDLRVPDCLQPDEHGEESLESQSLRRHLSQALVNEAATHAEIHPRQAAWMIVRGWKYRSTRRFGEPDLPESAIRNQLLDSADLSWAMTMTAESEASGDDSLVALYGELSACVFPRDDRQARGLAENREHPAWPYLHSFVEPTVPDDLPAQQLSPGSSDETDLWPDADAFLADQAQLLAQARNGDTDSLWQFLWWLRVDPQNGQLIDLSGSITEWASSAALNDALGDILQLALHYLINEHDHAESWLGQSTRDKRSWAGYALLTELHHMNRLAELPPTAWGSWTGAILTEFVGMSTSYREPARTQLLHMAALHAPEGLSQRITQFVTAMLAAGQRPVVLQLVDPKWATELRAALESIVTELSNGLGITQSDEGQAGPSEPPVQESGLSLDSDGDIRETALATWYSILVCLLTADSETAVGIVDTALQGYAGSPDAARAAVLAAGALLAADAETNWPRVKTFVEPDSELGRSLAEQCAGTDSAERIRRTLSEVELADLYIWLSDLYPPDEDGTALGFQRVTPESEARRWRDRLLIELSRRATADAVHQLRKLVALNPDRLSIGAALIAGRTAYSSARWSQVEVDDIIRVLNDPTRRVIRSSIDLLDVTSEVLEAINEELPSHSELLWDRIQGKRKTRDSPESQAIPDRWRPKPEAALCAYLAHELTLRLAGHRVAVNREVLIHPTDAYGAGDRTDILIDAPPPHKSADSAMPARLVIEVKGAWNPGVMTSQEDQLAGRYLPEVLTDSGIYLVGWFPIELWDDSEDKRRTEAKKHPPNLLLPELKSQSIRLSQERSVDVRPVVLTIPRPHKE
ncbi:NACHT domain-containing protein [Rhodococcus sp. NPDC057014]|uniref:NACHT domain-containing protein n=1 Tax=Rhodococcus sp. NPDC057014 TaxID=3346000 RepID=UPI003633796C